MTLPEDLLNCNKPCLFVDFVDFGVFCQIKYKPFAMACVLSDKIVLKSAESAGKLTCIAKQQLFRQGYI